MIPQKFSILLKQLREEIENTTDATELYNLDEQIDDLAGLAADTIFKLEDKEDERDREFDGQDEVGWG